jgi:hypothetical protein
MSALPLPRPATARHSFYERLGVAVDADVATLRTAWEGRQAALPVTLDPIERAVCLAELREALDVLSDPTRRAAYDERLRERERETRVLRPHGQALSDPVAQAADRERVRAPLGLPAAPSPVATAHDAAANEPTAPLDPAAPSPRGERLRVRPLALRRRPWLIGLGSGLGAAVLVLALAPVTQSSVTRELSEDAARAAATATAAPAAPARSHAFDGEPLPLRLSGELPTAR